MIILLDGAKGAGKSSTGKILCTKLSNTIFLSLDDERRIIPNQEKTRTELNGEAFENVIKKAKKYLEEDKNIIIDCGLTPLRIDAIEHLAITLNKKIYKFFLKAHYDTLLDRVRFRDAEKGKETNIERFDEVHEIVHLKEFKDFNIIETDKLDLNEVVDLILGQIS